MKKSRQWREWGCGATVVLLIAVFGSWYFQIPTWVSMQRHKRQWAQHNITNYRYTVELDCFCIGGPQTFEVRDGKVAAPVDSDWEDKATIDRMFAVVLDTINRRQAIEVEYDSTFGYPKDIYIDQIRIGIDDEIRYRITSFEVLR